MRTSQWSAISSPPPSAAPLTAASVGNGSSRSRPNSSWPARPPSRARSAVIPGNCVMSAPAAKTSGLPVRTRPRQSRVRRLPSTSASDASAAAPNVFGFCQSAPLSIVTSATGPTCVCELLEVELRDRRVSHGASFSQRSAAPIPRPMQSAVRP